MKELENGKETHYAFVGDIDYNISAASGAPIIINGKGHFQVKTVCIRTPPGSSDLTACNL
jgi:hypothetical protein